MEEDCKRIVGQYKNCQRNKLVRKGTRVPMIITDTPKELFRKIQIDSVGILPATPKGNTHILTIRCNFSKHSDAFALKDTESVTIARALAEEFIARYGVSKTIHTDQGQNLISRVIKTLRRIFKIRKLQSSAYLPQSLGSLERSHQSLIEYIRLFKGAGDWDDWLRFAIFSYNINVHESTGYAPYTLVFGKEAYFPTSFPSGLPDRTYCDHLKELFSKFRTLNSVTDISEIIRT